MSLKDLAQHLRELEFPVLRIEHVDGAHFRVLAFAVAALLRRQPVVVSFAPLNCPRDLHAVLCIGLSGGMQDRRWTATIILAGALTQVFCYRARLVASSILLPVNARLEFSVVGKRERTGAYLTAWNRYRITLTGVISLQLAGSAGKDFKSP